MMLRHVFLTTLLLLGCDAPVYQGAGTGPASPIECPGTQCECPCAAPLFCGPNGACTKTCFATEDCGGAAGETCLKLPGSKAGLCGVVCRPGGPDDCGAIGMNGGVCMEIESTNVCGYATPEPEGADGLTEP